MTRDERSWAEDERRTQRRQATERARDAGRAVLGLWAGCGALKLLVILVVFAGIFGALRFLDSAYPGESMALCDMGLKFAAADRRVQEALGASPERFRQTGGSLSRDAGGAVVSCRAVIEGPLSGATLEAEGTLHGQELLVRHVQVRLDGEDVTVLTSESQP